MKGKIEELRMPMKSEEAAADFLEVKQRREARLCGACGHNPCECKRPIRKQKRASISTAH